MAPSADRPPFASHRWLLVLTVAPFVAVLAALYVVTPPSPDHSIFDYIGWRLVSGDRAYVDVIEQNWAGAMWLHAMSTALFGNHLWSFRAFDLLLFGAGAAALVQLARTAGSTTAGWIVVPLYLVMYATENHWFSGQRDIVAANLSLALVLLYWHAGQTRRRLLLMAAGGGLAFVVLIRPTFLLFPVLLVALDLLTLRESGRQWRLALADALLACAGAALFFAAVALRGHVTGGLQGWIDAAVLFNVTSYSHSSSLAQVAVRIAAAFGDWHWLVALAAVGAYLLWTMPGARRVLGVAAALIVTGVVSAAAQGKGFQYHLGPCLPALALLAAFALAWAVEQVRSRAAALRLALGALMVVVALAGSAKKVHGALAQQFAYLSGRTTLLQFLDAMPVYQAADGVSVADAVRVAEYLRSHTKPEDTVLVWSRAMVIHFLAERRSPLPFATVPALETVGEAFPRRRAWLGTIETAFARRPPSYVVLSPAMASKLQRDPSAAPDADTSEAERMVLAAVRERYAFETAIGQSQLYRFAGGPAQGR